MKPLSLMREGQIVGADHVGAGLLGLAGLLALGEDGDAAGLAGAVREHQGAADHLVGPPRVHVEVDVGLDALVELGPFEALDELDGLARRVAALRVYLRPLFQQPSTH
jgi:hypothetical protein